MIRLILLVVGHVGAVMLAVAAFFSPPPPFVISTAVALYLIGHVGREVSARRAWKKELDEVRDQNTLHLRALLGRMNEHHWPQTSGVRSTILLPDEKHESLTPAVRYYYGQPNKQCNSRAVFKKGMGLVGIAWADIVPPFTAEIGPFEDREDFLRFYEEEFKMPRQYAALLDEHMLNVRSILCVGLVDRDGLFRGVLSVDSTAEGTFSDADKLRELAPYVELIQDVLELREG